MYKRSYLFTKSTLFGMFEFPQCMYFQHKNPLHRVAVGAVSLRIVPDMEKLPEDFCSWEFPETADWVVEV